VEYGSKKKKTDDPRTEGGSCRKIAYRKGKEGPAQYKNVAKSVIDLPDDHYLSYKSVKKWIKTQQEIARAERKNGKKC